MNEEKTTRLCVKQGPARTELGDKQLSEASLGYPRLVQLSLANIAEARD